MRQRNSSVTFIKIVLNYEINDDMQGSSENPQGLARRIANWGGAKWNKSMVFWKCSYNLFGRRLWLKPVTKHKIRRRAILKSN